MVAQRSAVHHCDPHGIIGLMHKRLKRLIRLVSRGTRVVRVRRRRVGAFTKSKKAYLTYKETARTLVTERLAHFNKHYGLTWGTVSIRDQRTRWGSCSKRGNLNFNYRLALLPTPLADYVIVHELCHRGEFSHSKAFWALVAQTIPDHSARRKAIHAYAKKHFTRTAILEV